MSYQAVMETERLRGPMRKIADRIMELVTAEPETGEGEGEDVKEMAA